jgi:ribonuclease P protein component
MTPPEAARNGTGDGNASTGTAPPAVFVCPPAPLGVLRKRADFLRAARARRQAGPGLILQARQRGPDDPPAPLIRVGFTATKKIGNAVARNRAKRRLRAIARETLPTRGHPGWDYVLIARADVTATRPFADLVQDLTRALEKIHAPR